MITGVTIAQALPFLASPILVLFYSPAEFGWLSLFVSTATLGFVLFGGRYDLAVMLPEKDEDAIHLGRAAIFIALAMSGLALIVVLCWGEWAVSLLGGREFLPWLMLVPAMVAAQCVYQTLSTWCNRLRLYPRLAHSEVGLKVAAEGSKVGLGVMEFPGGLVWGTFLGQLMSIFIVGIGGRSHVTAWSWSLMRANLIRYWKVPVFTMPYSLMASIGTEMLMFGLAMFAPFSVVGYVGFTRRIVLFPVTFFSSALGRIYYQYASKAIGTPQLEALTLAIMRALVIACLPAVVFCMLWSESIFELLFGEQWRAASIYAIIMAPYAFLFLFTSWPERVYEIAGRQDVSFSIQLVFDIIKVTTLLGILALDGSVETALIGYFAVGCIYQIAYLLGIFHCAGFDKGGIVGLCRYVFAVGTVSAVFFISIRMTLPGAHMQLILGAIVLLCYLLLVRNNLVSAISDAFTPQEVGS